MIPTVSTTALVMGTLMNRLHPKLFYYSYSLFALHNDLATFFSARLLVEVINLCSATTNSVVKDSVALSFVTTKALTSLTVLKVAFPNVSSYALTLFC